jgi:radical SAM-linked protein
MKNERPREQQKNFRYRTSFEKKGAMRGMSPLNLTIALREAFQQAAIPITYSGAKQPQPVLSFGPALPMSVEAKEEFLDFFTYHYVSPEELVSTMNEVLPPDLRFLVAAQISKGAAALGVLIDGADYAVNFSCDAGRQVIEQMASVVHILPADVHSFVIERFGREHEILFTREKNEKVVNIKEFVRSLVYLENLEELRVEMKIIGGQTAGIRHVLKALYSSEAELPITRERLYLWNRGNKRSPLTIQWEDLQMQKRFMDFH